MSDSPRPRFTWKQKILFLLLTLVAPFWLRIAYYGMTQERLHPSKETTYLTEPLREDGTVDYAAALNELNKQGVTPENNAAVVLAQFYGPSVAGLQYCAEIGIDPLPPQGDYYVPFGDYSGRGPEFRMHFPGMPVEEPGEDREIIEQFDLAKWLPWTAARWPRLSTWVERNEKAFAHLVSIRDRPEYYNPILDDDLLWRDHFVSQNYRDLASELMVAAMLAIGEKDFGKAQDFLDVLYHICLCEAHEIGFISQLQFTVEVSQVHYLIVRLLEAEQTSPDQLERYRRILGSLNEQPGFAEQLAFGDRLENLALLTNEMYRPYLQGGAETPLVDGVLISDWTSLNRIDWNIVYKTFNEIYDEKIHKLQERVDGNKPYDGSDWFDSLNEEFWTDELIAAHPHTLNYDISLSREEFSRRLGVSTHSLVRGDTGDESYRRSEITRQMRYRLIQTALHLEEYFFSHGEYPEKLSANILGVDPEDLYDPFSDRTFTYHKMSSGYKLYSWGLNGVDNEGRNYDVFPYGDDYTISIYRKHDSPARAERPLAE